jgi:ribosomal protein L31
MLAFMLCLETHMLQLGCVSLILSNNVNLKPSSIRIFIDCKDNKAEQVRATMTSLGIKKEPGVSWTVDANGNSHTFYAGEQYHPRMQGIPLFSNCYNDFSRHKISL